ncbi:MAG: substrate-binding domain-containing protein [Clostridia bacterium]|nr:substrate-binding domain-containing protein [Clostridia bacterium]
MTKTKLGRQILILVSLALVFVILNLGIYNIFTYRCVNVRSEVMQAKSIELGEYLPFAEDSKVVKHTASLSLEGELPIFDGAAALYPVFSGFVHALYPEDSVEFDGADFTENSALQMNNTRDAYKKIVDGDTDIAICAKPSAEQLAYAEEQGVELEFVPIGREAFVFLVNKQNPVDSLTVDQIRGIYSGEYTNWAHVGGEHTPIGALQRNEGSGSQTAFLGFMGDVPVKTDRNTFLGSAIGFSFRYYVEDVVQNGNVKMLSLNGVYPNEENIKNGTYPIINEIYAVYRTDNDNPNVPAVIDWILSEEGQAIIEETGYVGIAKNK